MLALLAAPVRSLASRSKRPAGRPHQFVSRSIFQPFHAAGSEQPTLVEDAHLIAVVSDVHKNALKPSFLHACWRLHRFARSTENRFGEWREPALHGSPPCVSRTLCAHWNQQHTDNIEPQSCTRYISTWFPSSWIPQDVSVADVSVRTLSFLVCTILGKAVSAAVVPN